MWGAALQVCKAQLQFSLERRWPIFGGTRGDGIKQSIKDICASFAERVRALAAVNYDILDVKVTLWRDDLNEFKAAVKDLEELLIKATDHAIESVSGLQDHILLIESLQARTPVTTMCLTI
jgi:Dynein heavy chain, N-terminal region 1